MSEEHIEVHNPNDLPLVEYPTLTPLQGDLKVLFQDQREELRASITEHGIFIPFFTWEDEEGTLWVMDGHQRLEVLAELEEDGWEVPPVPVAHVTAEDKSDAAEKLLQINSQYGKVNPSTTFLEDMNLPTDVLADLEVPNLDFSETDFEVSSTVHSPVDQEDVDEAEEQMAAHEKERQEEHEESMVEIMCPHCREAFQVREKDLPT